MTWQGTAAAKFRKMANPPDPVAALRGMAMEPDPWQERLLRDQARHIGVMASRQAGKALPLDTPIATPDGWTTMGAIRVGERVFDQDGRPCTVTAISPVMRNPVLRVTFSDHSEIVADGGHLWTVLDHAARSNMQRKEGRIPADWHRWQSRRIAQVVPIAAQGKPRCAEDKCERPTRAMRLCTKHYQRVVNGVETSGRLDRPNPTARTITTEDMVQQLTIGSRGDTNLSIPATLALDLPSAILPIDPYTLGVWLGDGNSNDGRITKAECDSEIVERIRAAGYVVEPRPRPGGSMQWLVRGLHVQLRMTGLLHNKHIPAPYLRASIEQRMELLRGLMDTDGYADPLKLSCEFTTVREVLADGFCELATSLGLLPLRVRGTALLNGREIGPKWRINVCPSFVPFHLKRA